MPTSSSLFDPEADTSGSPANQEKFKARETQSNDKSGLTHQPPFGYSSQWTNLDQLFKHPTAQQPDFVPLLSLVTSLCNQINFYYRTPLQPPETIYLHLHFPAEQSTSTEMPFTASDICKIILAVILPPLGVFLERGCGADFLINILLTILGYFPGIIHALYIILKY
ncbi:hypothetical protein F4803DRAFT_298392 [Xylaria telfairii]|nr:hypothetical protein F4803DRAFT_298392 [Xylaria telfairii]